MSTVAGDHRKSLWVWKVSERGVQLLWVCEVFEIALEARVGLRGVRKDAQAVRGQLRTQTSGVSSEKVWQYILETPIALKRWTGCTCESGEAVWKRSSVVMQSEGLLVRKRAWKMSGEEIQDKSLFLNISGEADLKQMRLWRGGLEAASSGVVG